MSIEEGTIDRENHYKFSKKKPLNLIVFIVVAIVVIGFLFFYISPLEDDKTIDDTPKVVIFETASNVVTFGDYDPEITFDQGDVVYIYLEYSDISIINNDSCDIIINLTIKSNEGQQKHSDIVSIETVGNNSYAWWFFTDDSWETGKYIVTLDILDNITKKSVNAQTNFVLSYKPPEINVLTTASAVRAFNDYDPILYFLQNDTVYVYLEYSNILLNDLSECDLYLEINISFGDDKYYSFNTSKSVVGNNSHAFWFNTDESWPTDVVYTVDLYLLDNLSMRSVTGAIYFSLY